MHKQLESNLERMKLNSLRMLFALRVSAQCACLLHDGLTVNVAALHFVQINKSPLIPSPLRSEYMVEQCAVFVIINMTNNQSIYVICMYVDSVIS